VQIGNSISATTFRMIDSQKGGGLTSDQQEDLRLWARELHALGRSPRTVERYVARLVPFARKHAVPFDVVTKNQIMEHLSSIGNEVSRRDFGVVIKLFLRWKNQGRVPPCIAWWKAGKIDTNLLPENILTEQEVLALLNDVPGGRDRTVVHVLYDTGMRVGEVLALRRQHVSFDHLGAVILIPGGKSGRRRLRAISSAPALREHVNGMSDKRPEAPLWTTYVGLPLGYQTVLHTIQRAAKSAGIGKNVTCHSLRHARATVLRRKGVSESSLRSQFGWTKESVMVERYSHLSSEDVDNELAKAAGMPTPEQDEKSCLAPVKCAICGRENDATYSFCTGCNSSLVPGVENTLDVLENLIVQIASLDLSRELDEFRKQRDPGVVDGTAIQRDARLLDALRKLSSRANEIQSAGVESARASAAAKVRKPRGRQLG